MNTTDAITTLEARCGCNLDRYRELTDAHHPDYDPRYIALIYSQAENPPPDPPPAPPPTPESIQAEQPEIVQAAPAPPAEAELLRAMTCPFQRLCGCAFAGYECAPGGRRPGQKVSADDCRACLREEGPPR